MHEARFDQVQVAKAVLSVVERGPRGQTRGCSSLGDWKHIRHGRVFRPDWPTYGTAGGMEFAVAIFPRQHRPPQIPFNKNLHHNTICAEILTPYEIRISK
jgi:hypothetical protein